MIIQANPDYISREVGGEHLLIPLSDDWIGTDDLIMLNETGSFIWDNIQEPISIEALIERAQKEFECAEGQIAQDVSDFITGMIQVGFIKRRD